MDKKKVTPTKKGVTVKKPIDASQGVVSEEKNKIVDYLNQQLELKKEQLKYFEAPIDPETIKDVRKMEEMLMKREVWQLESLIKQIKWL